MIFGRLPHHLPKLLLNANKLSESQPSAASPILRRRSLCVPLLWYSRSWTSSKLPQGRLGISSNNSVDNTLKSETNHSQATLLKECFLSQDIEIFSTFFFKLNQLLLVESKRKNCTLFQPEPCPVPTLHCRDLWWKFQRFLKSRLLRKKTHAKS